MLEQKEKVKSENEELSLSLTFTVSVFHEFGSVVKWMSKEHGYSC